MDTHWTHTRVIDTQRISSDVLRGNGCGFPRVFYDHKHSLVVDRLPHFVVARDHNI